MATHVNRMKELLGLNELIKFGHGGSGCISQGDGYHSEIGDIFVKRNKGKSAKEMFDGEFLSLKEITKTVTIRVPQPIKVLDDPEGGAILVTEYLQMSSLNKFSSDLGERLAEMHLSNKLRLDAKQNDANSINKKNITDSNENEPVHKFGFDVPTCCGSIPQLNEWNSNWMEFFSRNRLLYQINMLLPIYGDRELSELWSELQLKISSFFPSEINIFPALLHGDLWSGNVGETSTEAVIFDPASFYGHHEYEMGIVVMFGGFSKSFFTTYHKLIPKSTQKYCERLLLYELYHNLNHWNHFGEGYRSSSISLMKRLCSI